MLNPNVRDLEFNIPQDAALADFENNLTSSGLERGAEGTWQRFNDRALVYEFRELNAIVHGEWLDVSGEFVMPVPWPFGDVTEVSIPDHGSLQGALPGLMRESASLHTNLYTSILVVSLELWRI